MAETTIDNFSARSDVALEMEQQLNLAEAYLARGETEHAYDLLHRLADEAELYIDQVYHTDEQNQYFSFTNTVEYLGYKHIEDDPREIHQVPEQFARMYYDLAIACSQLDEKEATLEALKQSVRWNPMSATARLMLAEVYRALGNKEEYYALSYSALIRALSPTDLARGYLNFVHYFREQDMEDQQIVCLHFAHKFNENDARVRAAWDESMEITDEEASDLLEGYLPGGANVELVVTLLIQALDPYLRETQPNQATNYYLQAVRLVGEKAVKALVAMLEETQDA